MARKIKITCKYYWVRKYAKEGNGREQEIFDLNHWLNKIRDLNLKEKVKTIGDTKGRLDACNREGEIFAFNFIKMEEYSSMYILGTDKSAEHVDISVSNDEYIGKNTVAIYDAEKGIMMVMGNRGGFSPYSISSYINSFYEEPVCILEPIKETKNFMSPYNKYGKIAIKISSVKDFIPSKNVSYEQALSIADSMKSETLSFEFSVGRKKNEYLDANIVRTIISDAFSNLGVVSIAQVRMTDEDGTALYNLLENVVNSVFWLNADERGEISFSAIAKKMIEEYLNSKYAK